MRHKFFALLLAAMLLVCPLASGCTGQGQAESGTDAEQSDRDDLNGQENQKDNDSQNSEETPVERKKRKLAKNFTYKVAESEFLVHEEGGVVLYGKMWAPTDAGKYPAVVFSHGFNGTNDDFYGDAYRMAMRGYVAYTFDYAGASAKCKSTGRTPTELTLFTMKADLIAVIRALQELDNVDETQVFLFGGSQGGLITALVAAELKEEISAIALLYPAFQIPDDWRNTFKTEAEIPETYEPYNWGLTLGKVYFTSMRDLDPFEIIGQFDKDVLIYWGTNDNIVSRAYMDRAVETYAHAELEVLQGEGHGFSANGATTARKGALDFFEKRTYEPLP